MLYADSATNQEPVRFPVATVPKVEPLIETEPLALIVTVSGNAADVVVPNVKVAEPF